MTTWENMRKHDYGSYAAMFIKIASEARHKGEAAMDFIAPKEPLYMVVCP